MSVNSAGRWLSETLEVISGRSVAPVKPQEDLASPRYPSLPVTSTGGVERLPSQDSLDRSVRNETGSGSQKSKAQIIHDLKASNARLTAQSAKMEVDFMNQLGSITADLEIQREALQDELARKETQMKALESRCKSSESRIGDKDSLLARMKEDSAFQRHTISDLRAQLQAKESCYREMDAWKEEKQQLIYQLESLRQEHTICTDTDSQSIDSRDSVDVRRQELLDADQSFDTVKEKVSVFKELLLKDALYHSESSLASAQAELTKLKAVHEQKTNFIRQEYNAVTDRWQTMGASLRSQIGSLQDGQSVEEDLRKELEAARGAREHARETFEAVVANKEVEVRDLREKLQDRDTAISTLAKASVAAEHELILSNSNVQALSVQITGMAEEKGIDVTLAKGVISEHVDDMKASIAEYKETEVRLSKEIFRLKRQLTHCKLRNNDVSKLLNFDSIVKDTGRAFATINSDSEKAATQTKHLQEGEYTIANNVMQTVSRERTVGELKHRPDKMTNELNTLGLTSGNNSELPPGVDVEKLLQETEMFAGQVIEQDEQIDSLRKSLLQKNELVTQLEKIITRLRKKETPSNSESDRNRVLEAEIDELRESNRDKMEELRLLRRTAREFALSADCLAEAQQETRESQRLTEEYRRMVEKISLEKTELYRNFDKERLCVDEENFKLEYAEAAKKLQDLESALKDRNLTIEGINAGNFKVASRSCSLDETQKAELIEQNSILQRSFENQSFAIDAAKATIRELETLLASKNASESSAFEQEKVELLSEIELLANQLYQAREYIRELHGERSSIDEFKVKLERSDEAREESEKSIIDTYERKLSLLTLDKDVTIDKLREKLSTGKNTAQEDLITINDELMQSQATLKDVRNKTATRLRQRDTLINSLENSLEAQEQLILKMKLETGRLPAGMVSTSVERRDTIEGMQRELADLTSTSKRQVTKIESLRMEIENRKLIHEAEVKKLRDRISSYGNAITLDDQTSTDLQ